MASEKRLIDANAAVELLRSIGSRDYRREKGTIADAMKMLSHPAYTPTVEAVEVEHGRWNWSEENECWVCSNCEMSALNNYRGNSTDSNYCPNCGAKMDGDGNG